MLTHVPPAAAPGTQVAATRSSPRDVAHSWPCFSRHYSAPATTRRWRTRCRVVSDPVSTSAALAPGAAVHVVRSAGDLTAVDGLGEDVPLGVRVTFGGDATCDGGNVGVLLARVNGYGVVLRWPASEGGGDTRSSPPVEGTAVCVSRACAVVSHPDALLGRPPVDNLSAIITFEEGTCPAGAPAVAWPLPERRVLADVPGVPTRTPITRSLHTGVTAVDVLTPVGRGQCMLLVGERGSGKTALALDTLAAQAHTGVPCVYAAVGHADPADHALQAVAPHTVVVAPPRDASPGVSFLATCAAFALGEAWRDAGRDALLVVNSAQPAVAFWHAAMQLVPAPVVGNSDSKEEDLVQLDGMLVSASAAERRRFFSSFLQRCARLNADYGGGSLTLLAVLSSAPGSYAFGSGALAAAQAELSAARSKLASYATLSEAQKRKLLFALEAKVAQMQHSAQNHSGAVPAGTLSRPIVEEFMSVSDGQIFLQRPAPVGDGAGWRWVISPRDSVSRIGLDAASAALRAAGCGAARFELAQADDADAFAAGEEAAMKVQHSASRLRAALMQPPGRPMPLSQQVLVLLAVRAGACPNVPIEQLGDALHRLHARLLAQADVAAALRSIDETGQLSASAEAALKQALKDDGPQR